MRALLVAIAVLVCAPAYAGDVQGRELARQHFRAGDAKFRAGDYRGAIVEFLAADAIAPSAVLIHNVAVCHERLGARDEAVTNYREYLRRRPDAPNRAEVEQRIAALERPVPPNVLPPEDDALGVPRDQAGSTPTEPPRRAYDDAFARRVPSLGRHPLAPPSAEPPASEHGDAEPAPVAAAPLGSQQQPAPAPLPPEPKAKPVYKQWWFWVFVGVGAIILIDIASSAGDSGSTNNAAPASGLTLIRF